ncbi:MAG: hypothetical protein KF694_09520 [Mesorhizobium sp.]|nr:hypothetical protein [Mesorhizobium sp.]
MKKLIVAAAISAAAVGAAYAQEAPYTVMNGQVTYPGQMQWSAPSAPVYGDVYYGGASAAIPGGYYVSGPRYGGADYVVEPGYYADPYDRRGQGIFVFDGENVNNDQDYSGK